MEQDVGADEPADAATAFEALRREVALLNVAVAGLAAERAPAPDYSETLGEIAKSVSVAISRLGKVMTSPALATDPTQMARQIAVAAEDARRQDHVLLQQTTRDLQSWIDGARLANTQNWRLLQLGAAGLVVGLLFGIWAPNTIARAAPERWAWPERLAARTLGREPWAAGERLLAVADLQRWQSIRERLETGPSVSKACATDAPQRRRQSKARPLIDRRALSGAH